MDYYNQNQPMTPPPYKPGWSVVQQSNAILKRVYLRMFIGLLITGFVSLGIAATPALAAAILGNQIIFWGIMIGMLVMAFVMPARLTKMSTGTTLALFLLYSVLMGALIAPIFFVYRLGTIAYTFFITAGVFGAMSIYGFTTKTDLTKIGSFCMMALFGLIIAMVVNIFVASSTMDWIISIIGVLIFIGLTAWDTQYVKQLARMDMEPSMADKLATMAAMNLYLDFINMFLFLLRIFGGSRD